MSNMMNTIKSHESENSVKVRWYKHSKVVDTIGAIAFVSNMVAFGAGVYVALDLSYEQSLKNKTTIADLNTQARADGFSDIKVRVINWGDSKVLANIVVNDSCELKGVEATYTSDTDGNVMDIASYKTTRYSAIDGASDPTNFDFTTKDNLLQRPLASLPCVTPDSMNS